MTETTAQPASPGGPVGATSHNPGFRGDGTRVIRADDLELFANTHNLSPAEAEQYLLRHVWEGEDEASVLNDLRSNRVVYRQVYEQVHNSPANVLTAEDIRAARQQADLENAKKATASQELGKTPVTAAGGQAEGPHGAFADYDAVEAKSEEIAAQSGLPVDQVQDVVDRTKAKSVTPKAETKTEVKK